jgi:hypothetical protein
MFMVQNVIKMGLGVYNLDVTLPMIQNPYMGDCFNFNKCVQICNSLSNLTMTQLTMWTFKGPSTSLHQSIFHSTS